MISTSRPGSASTRPPPPGCVGGSDVTCIFLGDCPQPDVNLRVVTEFGGKSWIEDQLHIDGSPELLVDVRRQQHGIHGPAPDVRAVQGSPHSGISGRHREKETDSLAPPRQRGLPVDIARCRRRLPVGRFPRTLARQQALFKDDLAKVLATLQKGIDSDEHQMLCRRVRRAARLHWQETTQHQTRQRRDKIRFTFSCFLFIGFGGEPAMLGDSVGYGAAYPMEHTAVCPGGI